MGSSSFLQKDFVVIHKAQLCQEEGRTYKAYVKAACKGWSFFQKAHQS